jgi:hypothetical protein
VNRDELRSGALAGFLSAAATGGALIAIGRRMGTGSRPFNIIAAHALGARAAEVLGFVPLVTLTGVLLHAVVTTMLGVLGFSIVRVRLSPAWLVATGLSLLSGLVSIGIARRGGTSLASIFPAGDLVVYHLILAASLVAGIRFSLPNLAPSDPAARM